MLISGWGIRFLKSSVRSTDPATGRPLRDRGLLPNPCLRAAIAAITAIVTPPPPAAPAATPIGPRPTSS
jgi:hypothetical protein